MYGLEIAWQCDEERKCGVPGGWHRAIYDIDEVDPDNEYMVSRYGDGDWEPCDAEEYPTTEQHLKSWKDYSHWVIEHGLDPLDEFIGVKRTCSRAQRWIVDVGPSIACVVALRARHGRKASIYPHQFPSKLAEFLGISSTGNGRMTGFKSIADLDAALAGPQAHATWVNPRTKRQVTFLLTEKLDRSPKQYAQELRRAAHKSLQPPRSKLRRVFKDLT